MCHGLLALPVIGLIAFVVLPVDIALPLYALIAVVSALMYSAIWHALRRPPVTGLEGMAGSPARVVEALRPIGLIRCSGELWRAATLESAEEGARVWIERFERRPEGLTAIVRQTAPSASASLRCH